MRALFIGIMCLVLFSTRHASAAFNVCNHTGAELSVSVGWYNDNGWNVKGWFNVGADSCEVTVAEDLENQYVYFYAEGHGLTYKSEDNTGFFCADHTDSFYYTYDINSDNHCDGYLFEQVDIGQGTQDYVLTLTEDIVEPQAAALNCKSELATGQDAFISCWTRQMATARQKEILDCVKNTSDAASLAICSAEGRMSDRQKKATECAASYASSKATTEFVRCMADGELDPKAASIVNCAINNQGSYAAMAACAGGSMLSPEQRRLYSCIADHYNNYLQAGLCAASDKISPEQSRLINCVAQNRANYMQMGICAASGNKLTPEQQVFVQCAITTGGQPYAFAGCVGTQLTLNELQKCMTIGIGGNGCFGTNNEAVKFVRNAWNDVTKGPGPNNEIVKGREAILGGDRGTVANIIRDPIRCAFGIRKC